MRRVVVTGLGIVSSIGNNAEEVLASLQAGRSGIQASEQMAEYGFRSRVSGTLNIDVKGTCRQTHIALHGPRRSLCPYRYEPGHRRRRT